MGVLLATPLAVVTLVLVEDLYVSSIEKDFPDRPGAD
jgi:hypothetical protein